MTSILIATRNAHKVGEIRFILGTSFKFHTLADFVGSPQVIEDALSFEGQCAEKIRTDRRVDSIATTRRAQSAADFCAG